MLSGIPQYWLVTPNTTHDHKHQLEPQFQLAL